MHSQSVSIVIINHNYGRFLQQAIVSALNQKDAFVEIVVVDDGSTDESGIILDGLPAGIVQVRQAKGGHVRAVNAGFAASSGNPVIFLDADDVLYPGCVSAVLAFRQTGCVKIQYRLDTIDSEGGDLHLQFPTYPADLNPDEIRRRALSTGYYPWPVSSGNAYERAYLKQVLPIDAERIFKSPDGFLNKMAPLFGDVLTVNIVLAGYRVHGRNAWAHLANSAELPNYARTVSFDVALHQAFVELAATKGFKTGPYEKMPVPSWLEMRMLCLRLVRQHHPLPVDSVYRVLYQGLRAALTAPDLTAVGRVLWLVWFITLALLPKSILVRVVRAARSQSHRNRLARIAVSYAKT